MQCKCGEKIPLKAKFCPECGIAAPAPEPLPEPKKEEVLTAYEAADFLKISR